jgi:type I restriction enzyme, S subunit
VRLDSAQLPEGWRHIALGSVGRWGSGGTPDRRNAGFYGGSIPWIKIGDLHDGRITVTEETITEAGLSGSSAKLVEAGTVLVAMYGASIGKLGITGMRCATNQAIAFCVPDPDLATSEFLFQLLLYLRPTLIGQGKGGAQPNISQTVIKSMEVPLPPLDQQAQIVRTLELIAAHQGGATQHLVAARRRIKYFRQAALAAACSGKLTAEWREANPGEAVEKALARVHFKQSTTGRSATDNLIVGRCILSVGNPRTPVPEGWRWVPLSRVARLESGHTPSRKHPEYWNGSIPWIGIQDAREYHGGRIFGTRQSVNDLGIQNSAARLLPADTVCLSRTASVGYVLIMGRPMATSQDFVNWVCSEALLPDFLLYAIMAEGEGIRKFGRGTTHTTIYFPEVKALHICLPPIDEQREIVSRASRLLQLAEDLLARLDGATSRVRRSPQAVLAKAFRGDLVQAGAAGASVEQSTGGTPR